MSPPTPPPPPPPPPHPSLCPASVSSLSKVASVGQPPPLVGGAEPEIHGALMAELREFAKVRQLF